MVEGKFLLGLELVEPAVAAGGLQGVVRELCPALPPTTLKSLCDAVLERYRLLWASHEALRLSRSVTVNEGLGKWGTPPTQPRCCCL